jgi:hypothetical protein
MAEYKVLVPLNLPVIEVRKNPGDTVTDSLFEKAGQSKGQVKSLEKYGVISSDMNAEIDPAHRPVEPGASSVSDRHVTSSDLGSGDSNAS